MATEHTLFLEKCQDQNEKCAEKWDKERCENPDRKDQMMEQCPALCCKCGKEFTKGSAWPGV